MASIARLFEEDADLLQFVPEGERAQARRVATVGVVHADSGPWDPHDADHPPWGALVLRGLLARDITVAGAQGVELLGAGDVVLVGGPQSEDESVPLTATWTVLEPATLAVLDERVSAMVQRWPGIGTEFLQRADRRASRMAVSQAIAHITRVDTRILVLLWTLADRWGRVSAEGVVLPLRLTHRTLARLVGARRPTVTSALGLLVGRGLVDRRADGSWLLHGPLPEELDHGHLAPALSATPPAMRAADPKAAVANPRLLTADIERLAVEYRAAALRAERAASSSTAVRARSQRVREEIVADRVRRREDRPDVLPSA